MMCARRASSSRGRTMCSRAARERPTRCARPHRSGSTVSRRPRPVRYERCHARGRNAAPHFLIEDLSMLFTIAIILLILWALGFLAFHVGGGLIHILLVIAVIVIVYRLLTGQKVV